MPSFMIDEVYVGDIVSGEVVLRDVSYGETPVDTMHPPYHQLPPHLPDVYFPGSFSPDGFSRKPEIPICTADVRQCPDGSYVGRTGPMCEFGPCPAEPMLL